jgi:hypothetical protein
MLDNIFSTVFTDFSHFSYLLRPSLTLVERSINLDACFAYCTVVIDTLMATSESLEVKYVFVLLFRRGFDVKSKKINSINQNQINIYYLMD